MNTINDTIELIKKLILDPNCSRMNQSTIKGYLGELMVKEKLESEKLSVMHLGNQSSYDLQFNYKDEVFKIDVKFSTLKCEYHAQQKHWGWALVFQSKNRPILCTHFVCVAVDNKLQIIGYYVISQKHLEFFPSAAGRFKNVKHGFLIFEEKDFAPNLQEWYFQQYEKSKQLLESSTAVFVEKDDNLLDALSNPII